MGNEEKRRGPRTSVSGSLTIVTGSGQRLQGQAMDVSLLGCRFSAPELLAVGERVATTVTLPSGKTHAVEGTIKFVTAGSPYQYGVAFTQDTTERIIKDLIKLA